MSRAVVPHPHITVPNKNDDKVVPRWSNADEICRLLEERKGVKKCFVVSEQPKQTISPEKSSTPRIFSPRRSKRQTNHVVLCVTSDSVKIFPIVESYVSRRSSWSPRKQSQSKCAPRKVHESVVERQSFSYTNTLCTCSSSTIIITPSSTTPLLGDGTFVKDSERVQQTYQFVCASESECLAAATLIQNCNVRFAMMVQRLDSTGGYDTTIGKLLSVEYQSNGAKAKQDRVVTPVPICNCVLNNKSTNKLALQNVVSNSQIALKFRLLNGDSEITLDGSLLLKWATDGKDHVTRIVPIITEQRFRVLSNIRVSKRSASNVAIGRLQSVFTTSAASQLVLSVIAAIVAMTLHSNLNGISNVSSMILLSIVMGVLLYQVTVLNPAVEVFVDEPVFEHLNDTESDGACVVPECWLVAAGGDEVEARERWEESIEWRKRNNVDEILEHKLKGFDDIQSRYRTGFLGEDQHGNLVAVDYFNGIKKSIRELIQLGYSSQEFSMFFVYLNEYWTTEIQCKTGKLFKIIDLKGIGLSELNKDVLKYLGDANRVLQNYPELLYKIYIVNAPTTFSALWKVISPMLHKQTLAKIKVFSWRNHTVACEKLLEEIDPSVLPTCYAGSGGDNLNVFEYQKRFLSFAQASVIDPPQPLQSS